MKASEEMNKWSERPRAYYEDRRRVYRNDVVMFDIRDGSYDDWLTTEDYWQETRVAYVVSNRKVAVYDPYSATGGLFDVRVVNPKGLEYVQRARRKARS